MSYDILKNLGLEQSDPQSPDFLQVLERMQREALLSLQAETPHNKPVPFIDLGSL